MDHLSFYWLPHNKQRYLESLSSEFAEQVHQSIATGKISLPPIPEVVTQIQALSNDEATAIVDIADTLLEDPSLAAIVLKIANSVVFNRRNVTCHDLHTAVSRLGIIRVRDIVTAQSIEMLKHSVNISEDCKKVLIKSAAISKELAATMVLVTRTLQQQNDCDYSYLEQGKALLVGFLADIGLFCLVNEYHLYLENGNYIAPELALEIFQSQCSTTSKKVLTTWRFDHDFIEVACNQRLSETRPEVSYLDIARIAHYILLFRKQDQQALEQHEVEINVDGAQVMYQLTSMDDDEFQLQLKEILRSSGM
ncbi:HDOD domain-containing protein [Vibrio hippocampi]|uniref:HDOD domain-containing protein n=1 Tax=Vibrio hippocampi TaxID=654686 RepID=A0ABN8DG42_9VIBR|nr:HDOD domain-containing protein [Vibrio hippocampi]CAH0526049.1 hypothetical protein VHP8226_01535 [Vibrio hippocampi]